jgi:very-short-patch-repair endonuclease
VNALAPLPFPGERIGDYAQRLAIAFPTRELERLYSVGTVHRAVRSGVLARVAPGWAASAIHARAFTVRAQAVTGWADAPLSETSALFAWGLIPEPPVFLTVTTVNTRNPRAREGLKVRRVLRAPSEATWQGVRLVTPAEAIVGGFGRVERQSQSEVVFRAIRDRLTTPRQIRAVLAASPRVPSRVALERRVAAAEVGAHSHLEEVALREVFNSAEFAHFTRQHEVMIEGNAFFLDMYCRRTRIAIEADGTRFHAGAAAWQHAINRDAWLASIGVLTVRFSYADLNTRAEWCRERVREAMRSRI